MKVKELPGLAFDHAEILERVRAGLAEKLEKSTLVFQRVSAPFVISQNTAESLRRDERLWVVLANLSDILLGLLKVSG